MKALRILFLSLLIPLFVAGSLGFAQARVQAPVAGQIELCSGAGMVVLSVDADGQPVIDSHLCPDCVVGGHVATPAPALAAPQMPRRVLAPVWPVGQGQGGGCAAPRPMARGPPAAV